jgi:hypothetical protein
MTEEQVKEFIDYWGDTLPDPVHEPIRFSYYIKLYKHIKGIE